MQRWLVTVLWEEGKRSSACGARLLPAVLQAESTRSVKLSFPNCKGLNA